MVKLKNLLSVSTAILVVFFLAARPTLAHVVVKPTEVGIGSWQTFNIGVPVEKEVATVGMRLVIPEGLEYVMPNVKPGWKIEIKKVPVSGHPDIKIDDNLEEIVHEIIWTGGIIPTGQRDEFIFSAKVPGTETTLPWKAYQTYADGMMVAWENDAKAEQPKNAEGQSDFSESGPYSETKVINDLKETEKVEGETVGKSDGKTNKAMWLAMAAMVISVTSLSMQFSKKK